MKKLILVAGHAGSGKTHVGKILVKKYEPCVYMDKDTLTRPMVEALLELQGSYRNDRESEIYLNKVRFLEYNILMKHAVENLELGISVIVSAPFIKELYDKNWLSELKDEMAFEDVAVIVIWVQSDEETMKKRILSRNAARDEFKIKNWNRYVSNLSDESPVSDAIVIDNTERCSSTLAQQIKKISL